MKKFSLNLNETYRPSANRSQTTGSRGLVVLGRGRGRGLPKVAAPKPVNLPSLRAENAGFDPSVNLVPTGGAGWGRRFESDGGNKNEQLEQQEPVEAAHKPFAWGHIDKDVKPVSQIRAENKIMTAKEFPTLGGEPAAADTSSSVQFVGERWGDQVDEGEAWADMVDSEELEPTPEVTPAPAPAAPRVNAWAVPRDYSKDRRDSAASRDRTDSQHGRDRIDSHTRDRIDSHSRDRVDSHGRDRTDSGSMRDRFDSHQGYRQPSYDRNERYDDRDRDRDRYNRFESKPREMFDRGDGRVEPRAREERHLWEDKDRAESRFAKPRVPERDKLDPEPEIVLHQKELMAKMAKEKAEQRRLEEQKREEEQRARALAKLQELEKRHSQDTTSTAAAVHAASTSSTSSSSAPAVPVSHHHAQHYAPHHHTEAESNVIHPPSFSFPAGEKIQIKRREDRPVISQPSAQPQASSPKKAEAAKPVESESTAASTEKKQVATAPLKDLLTQGKKSTWKPKPEEGRERTRPETAPAGSRVREERSYQDRPVRSDRFERVDQSRSTGQPFERRPRPERTPRADATQVQTAAPTNAWAPLPAHRDTTVVPPPPPPPAQTTTATSTTSGSDVRQERGPRAERPVRTPRADRPARTPRGEVSEPKTADAAASTAVVDTAVQARTDQEHRFTSSRPQLTEAEREARRVQRAERAVARKQRQEDGGVEGGLSPAVPSKDVAGDEQRVRQPRKREPKVVEAPRGETMIWKVKTESDKQQPAGAPAATVATPAAADIVEGSQAKVDINKDASAPRVERNRRPRGPKGIESLVVAAVENNEKIDKKENEKNLRKLQREKERENEHRSVAAFLSSVDENISVSHGVVLLNTPQKGIEVEIDTGDFQEVRSRRSKRASKEDTAGTNGGASESLSSTNTRRPYVSKDGENGQHRPARDLRARPVHTAPSSALLNAIRSHNTVHPSAAGPVGPAGITSGVANKVPVAPTVTATPPSVPVESKPAGPVWTSTTTAPVVSFTQIQLEETMKSRANQLPEVTEQVDRDRPERPHRPERRERTERAERTERTQRTERPERAERTDRGERVSSNKARGGKTLRGGKHKQVNRDAVSNDATPTSPASYFSGNLFFSPPADPTYPAGAAAAFGTFSSWQPTAASSVHSNGKSPESSAPVATPFKDIWERLPNSSISTSAATDLPTTTSVSRPFTSHGAHESQRVVASVIRPVSAAAGPATRGRGARSGRGRDGHLMYQPVQADKQTTPQVPEFTQTDLVASQTAEPSTRHPVEASARGRGGARGRGRGRPGLLQNPVDIIAAVTEKQNAINATHTAPAAVVVSEITGSTTDRPARGRGDRQRGSGRNERGRGRGRGGMTPSDMTVMTPMDAASVKAVTKSASHDATPVIVTASAPAVDQSQYESNVNGAAPGLARAERGGRGRERGRGRGRGREEAQMVYRKKETPVAVNEGQQ